jgi:hypothetical protein
MQTFSPPILPLESAPPSEPLHIDQSAREQALSLPLEHRFTLGTEITPVQTAFLDEHGFILFSKVATLEEVQGLRAEGDRIATAWCEEDRKSVFGVPVFQGKGAEGQPYMQRLPFTSCFSEFVRDFVRDARFAPVRSLIGRDTRVGDQEKDGVVMNRYINVPGSAYPKLGWHTDGLRALAYLRLPGPMLNVGLHLDQISKEDGGLRIIPGSHKQGFVSMCFRKPYFVWHRPDQREVAIETQPGDLTVHDGRTWHRVQQSPHTGVRSLRRSMYVPYLTDAYSPKGDTSRTPVYHHIGRLFRWMKSRLS